MSQKNYPLRQALAATVAAFRTNDNSVVRLKEEKYESNRALVDNYLNGRQPHLNVTDKDFEQADEIVVYLQQTSMVQMLMRGSADSFLESVTKALAQETVEHRELGLLVWAPKLNATYLEKDQAKSISARYEFSSNWIGKIGEKIEVNFNLIESRFIKNNECWAVYGHDDHGNLIFYWAKSSEKVVRNGRIQGKVKAHNSDERRGRARVTNLNYVKVL
jgi:hypothetical protein